MWRIGHDLAHGWYTGPGSGRGAWVCKDTHCRDRVTVASLRRALRRDVTSPESLVVTEMLGQLVPASCERL
jgi:predicted RNA-binding protein YlxR (DUF448 family)